MNEPFLSTDQTDWFLNLPEKVKKQQFSREEQEQLATKCERAVAGYSSEAEEGSSCILSSSGASQRSSFESSHSLNGSEDCDSAVASTATEMEIFRLYNRRRSKMLDSAPPSPEPKVIINPPTPRKTLRQRLSLVPIPLPPPVLTPVPDSQSPRNFSRPGVHREFSASQSPFLSPNARYYQDPATRRQLKQCLASPQNFDEAIEFGFPTAVQPVELSANEVLTRTVSASSSMDRKDYDTDSFDSSGPATPTALTSDCSPTVDRLSSFSSSDHTITLHSHGHPHHTLGTTEVPSSPSASSAYWQEKREMTLRMTLTKSGLIRTPDEEVCAWQRGLANGCSHDAEVVAKQSEEPAADPLASERLPVVCEDATGAGDAFAPQRGNLRRGGEKRLGRMFRVLKL